MYGRPSSYCRIVRDECGTAFRLLLKVLKTKSLAYIVSMRSCSLVWENKWMVRWLSEGGIDARTLVDGRIIDVTCLGHFVRGHQRYSELEY